MNNNVFVHDDTMLLLMLLLQLLFGLPPLRPHPDCFVPAMPGFCLLSDC